MAVVIIGGQSLCLFITLLMTPVFYSIFDDAQTIWIPRWVNRWRDRLSFLPIIGRKLGESGWLTLRAVARRVRKNDR